MLPRSLAAVAAVAATAMLSPASLHAETYHYSSRTRAGIDRAAARGGRHVSVVVGDARTGRELFARRAKAPRVLASNTKLFVTAAAAERWGDRAGPMLAAILRPSDNALAEQLAARLGHGDRGAGIRIAVRFARSLGVRVHLGDAAGLDPTNTTTSEQMVRFLLAMRHVRGYHGWKRAFPLAGRSGTLAGRMRGTAA